MKSKDQHRYTPETFTRARRMFNDDDLRRKYDEWTRGINFVTKRKVKLGGTVHVDIGCVFRIPNQRFGILFAEIMAIDEAEYMRETIALDEQIARENAAIAENNESVMQARERIMHLTSWDCTLAFQGELYGLPSFVDGIHRENECLGEVEKFDVTSVCRACRSSFYSHCTEPCPFQERRLRCRKCLTVC